MIELVTGSSVYWTEVHKQILLSKCSCATQLVNTLVDIFFDKLTLAESNAKGGRTKYKPLSEAILNAIRGMFYAIR